MSGNVAVFLVWVGASAVLIGILALLNLYTHWRSLVAQGLPHPWLVTWQSSIGRLLPSRSVSISALVGRRALVCWDIRWVTSERTIADVVFVDINAGELGLRLTKPIHLMATESAPEVYLERVQFRPTNVRSLSKIGSKAVSGRLYPPIAEGLHATASIVVYPEGA